MRSALGIRNYAFQHRRGRSLGQGAARQLQQPFGQRISTGARREKTEWHRVVIFNPNLAKVAEQYLKKGSKVYLEGQLQTRKWTDQSGQDRYTTEVVLQRFRGELVMLDSRSSEGGFTADPPSPEVSDAPAPDKGGADDLDDEIPF